VTPVGNSSARVVAIDGPAGAGKSTVARQVASRLGLAYLDTGAMFRAVALVAGWRGIDPTNGPAVSALATSIALEVAEGRAHVDGLDVTESIRTPEINRVVSIVATHAGVREVMRQRQREWMAVRGAGVVEGRDITTVVFPDACLKVFLTASPEERAARRIQQGGGRSSEVAAEIAERDRIDSTRVEAPLTIAQDSIIIDSTGRSAEDVVDEIAALFGERCVDR